MRVRVCVTFGTTLLLRSDALLLRDRAVISSGRSVGGICRLSQAIVGPRSLAWTIGGTRGSGYPRLVDETEIGSHPHGSLAGEQRHLALGKRRQEESKVVVEPHFITKDVVRWLQLVLDGYAKFIGCSEQLVPRKGSKESQAVAMATMKDRAVLSHDFTRNPSDPIYCYGNKAALGLFIPACVLIDHAVPKVKISVRSYPSPPHSLRCLQIYVAVVYSAP